jgi:hypothetical protein
MCLQNPKTYVAKRINQCLIEEKMNWAMSEIQHHKLEVGIDFRKFLPQTKSLIDKQKYKVVCFVLTKNPKIDSPQY